MMLNPPTFSLASEKGPSTTTGAPPFVPGLHRRGGFWSLQLSAAVDHDTAPCFSNQPKIAW